MKAPSILSLKRKNSRRMASGEASGDSGQPRSANFVAGHPECAIGHGAIPCSHHAVMRAFDDGESKVTRPSTQTFSVCLWRYECFVAIQEPCITFHWHFQLRSDHMSKLFTADNSPESAGGRFPREPLACKSTQGAHMQGCVHMA